MELTERLINGKVKRCNPVKFICYVQNVKLRAEPAHRIYKHAHGAALLRRYSPPHFRCRAVDIGCCIANNGSGKSAGLSSALKGKPAFAVCV